MDSILEKNAECEYKKRVAILNIITEKNVITCF